MSFFSALLIDEVAEGELSGEPELISELNSKEPSFFTVSTSERWRIVWLCKILPTRSKLAGAQSDAALKHKIRVNHQIK